MTRTIDATDLQPGDYIIGDRFYAAGTLHLTVDSVSKTTFDNERTLVEVNATSAPYGVRRAIAYHDGEKVILGAPR